MREHSETYDALKVIEANARNSLMANGSDTRTPAYGKVLEAIASDPARAANALDALTDMLCAALTSDAASDAEIADYMVEFVRRYRARVDAQVRRNNN